MQSLIASGLAPLFSDSQSLVIVHSLFSDPIFVAPDTGPLRLLASQEPVYTLACGHTFHEECIDAWAYNNGLARNSVRCPTCRFVGADLLFGADLFLGEDEIGAAQGTPRWPSCSWC